MGCFGGEWVRRYYQIHREISTSNCLRSPGGEHVTSVEKFILELLGQVLLPLKELVYFLLL